MRRISAKRANLNRQVKPLRDEYRTLFPWCQWCGEQATDIHEISRGGSRESSLGVRAALLHLCRECHEHMNWLPVAAQLALKALSDCDGYCRETVNRLRGRAPNSITEEDVRRWKVRFTRAREGAWR